MKPRSPRPDEWPEDPELRDFAAFLAHSLDPGELSLEQDAREQLQAAIRGRTGGSGAPMPWQWTAEALGEQTETPGPADAAQQAELAATRAFVERLRDHLDPGEILLDMPRREALRQAARHGLRPHELTAWALGELDPERFLAVEVALAGSATLRAEASGLRAICELLWRFARPISRPGAGETRRIRRLFGQARPKRRRFAMVAGVAAAFAALASIGLLRKPSPAPALLVEEDMPQAIEIPASGASRPLVPVPAAAFGRPAPMLTASALPPPRPWPQQPASLPATDLLPLPRRGESAAISPAVTLARQRPSELPRPRSPLPSLDPASDLPTGALDTADLPEPGTGARALPPALASRETPSTPIPATPATNLVSQTLPPAPLPDPGVNFATTTTGVRIGVFDVGDPDDTPDNPPVDPGNPPVDPGNPPVDPGNASTDADPPLIPPPPALLNRATLTLGGLQPYLLLGLQRVSPAPPPPQAAPDAIAWFAEAGYRMLEYDSLIGPAGFHADTWAGSASASFLLGGDFRLLAGASRCDSRVDVDGFGKVNLTGDTLAFALDWQSGPWRVAVAPLLTSFDQELFRQDSGTFHRADQDGRLFSLSLVASHSTEWRGWLHGPIATVDAAWGELDAYLESGPNPLAVAPRSFHSLSALAGWHFTGSFGQWTPHAMIGWRHEFEAPDSAVIHSAPGGFVGGYPATPSPDALLLEAGLRWQADTHLSLHANCLTEWRTSGPPDHSLAFTVRWTF